MRDARERALRTEPATSVRYPPRRVMDIRRLGIEPTEVAGQPIEDRILHKIESICGAKDDSQAVEVYDGTLGVTKEFVGSHERAVGQIQWNANLATKYTNAGSVSGVRWCSGTLIAPNVFLTAGHCFDVEDPATGWSYPRKNGTGAQLTPAEIAKEMHVNFNYQRAAGGQMRQESSFAVTRLVEHRLGGLDYAIIRLKGHPEKTFGSQAISKTDAAVGDMLCIIGHPQGLPKRIAAGPTSDLSGELIGYNTLDTLGGNSGSGILGPTGMVVGVHTNGGCDDPAVGHNYGVRISAIAAVSPTVRKVQ
jgi:V8-like Glu-specific endopeptidase